jgi:hypothetical protein
MLRRFIFQQCVERRFGLPCVRFDRVKLLHGYSARHVGRQLLALFWSECRLPLDRTSNRSPFSASQIAGGPFLPSTGGRVVRQRSYTGQSKRRNLWSGYAA